MTYDLGNFPVTQDSPPRTPFRPQCSLQRASRLLPGPLRLVEDRAA
jgi:hypothetical protein